MSFIKKGVKALQHLVFFTLALGIFSNSSLAQTDEDLDGLVADTKSDILVVVGGGLAGAVLGLSTLSFVDEPKDHTRNILVGASIGIIAGVAVVAFSQASKSRDLIYGSEEGTEASLEFNTRDRKEWHATNTIVPIIVSPYKLGVSFRY
jgi:hypothetical protein